MICDRCKTETDCPYEATINIYKYKEGKIDPTNVENKTLTLCKKCYEGDFRKKLHVHKDKR